MEKNHQFWNNSSSILKKKFIDFEKNSSISIILTYFGEMFTNLRKEKKRKNKRKIKERTKRVKKEQVITKGLLQFRENSQRYKR